MLSFPYYFVFYHQPRRNIQCTSYPVRSIRSLPSSLNNLLTISLKGVRFSELMVADASTAIQLSDVFTSLGGVICHLFLVYLIIIDLFTHSGMLEIKGIPLYSAARVSALQSAANCFSNAYNVPNIVMNDGSHRRTTAAATNNGVQEKFNNDCGNKVQSLTMIHSLIHKYSLTQVMMQID